MSARILVLAVAAALLAAPVRAHDHSAAPQVDGAAPAAEKNTLPRGERARAYFTDLPVVTEDGERRRFYSDVLQGRTVLVSLFYTSCEEACPLVNAKIADVQDLLGERVGRDMLLVSLTVDPETDTPAVLKAYARRFEAGPGWLFLTGTKEDIRTLVGRFGQRSDDPADHVAAMFVGNVDKGRWRRLPPMATHEEIAEFLRAFADAPG